MRNLSRGELREILLQVDKPSASVKPDVGSKTSAERPLLSVASRSRSDSDLSS